MPRRSPEKPTQSVTSLYVQFERAHDALRGLSEGPQWERPIDKCSDIAKQIEMTGTTNIAEMLLKILRHDLGHWRHEI